MLKSDGRRSVRVASGVAAAVLIAIAFPVSADAESTDSASETQYLATTTSTEQVSLAGCDASVAGALAQTPDAIEPTQDQLCEGTATITEQRFIVGTDQAAKIATEAGMTVTQSSALVARAATGAVQGATWEHVYWSGTVKEVHKGTTYWDGTKAWIGTYRGLTGKHECGTQGSYAIGATVSDRSCSKPGPSAKADAQETFNLSIDTPISANFRVGLHYAINKDGIRSSWQVGG